MDDKKYEKIMDGLKSLEVGQAVTNEKLNQVWKSINKTNTRLDSTNDNYKKLESRVDKHDKIVGAIGIAFTILGVMLKYKLI